MSRIKGHLRYYLMSSKSDLIFALVMVGIIMVINLAGRKGEVEATGYVSVFFTTFIFYFIGIGINNVFETFPYMMGFSSTRKEFYLGLLAKYAIAAGTFSGFIVILFELERIVFRMLGLSHVTYLELWGRNVSGLSILIFIFIFYMFILSFFNLFSLLMIRFAKKQFFLIGAALAVVGYLVNTMYPVILDTIVKLFFKVAGLYLNLPLLVLVLWLALLSLLLYGLGWLYIRRAEVKVFTAGT